MTRNGRRNEGNQGSAGALARLADVPLRIEVELGRTTLPIATILALRPGAMVELDRVAGEAVDVRVNGKLVARGEVVVVNERYAVRITEVVGGASALEDAG